MVSELDLDILPLFWQKKNKKTNKYQFWPVLTFVANRYMGQILSKLNFETIFGIVSSRRTFSTPI